MKRKKDDDLLNFEFSELDKHQLDIEWIRQEKLVHKFAVAVAEARKKVDIAKSALEVREAMIDKKIRKDPAKYGLDKTTEGAVGKEVIMQLENFPEGNELIDAKYDLAILQAGLERLSARGKAISDLIFLFSIEYFASPKIPKGMTREDADRIKNRPLKGVRPNRKGD